MSTAAVNDYQERIDLLLMQREEASLLLKNAEANAADKDAAAILIFELQTEIESMESLIQCANLSKYFADLALIEASDAALASSLAGKDDARQSEILIAHVNTVKTLGEEGTKLDILKPGRVTDTHPVRAFAGSDTVIQSKTLPVEARESQLNMTDKEVLKQGRGTQSSSEDDNGKDEEKNLKNFAVYQSGYGNKTEKCSGCYEIASEYTAFSCKHVNCYRCLKELFLHALKDRSLVPLKCCRVEIDFSAYKTLLTPSEQRKLESFYTESLVTRKMFW